MVTFILVLILVEFSNFYFMKYSIFYLSIACLIISCTNSNEDDLTYSNNLEIEISYQEHIKPIMSNNCVICHAETPINGSNISLTTYEDVVSGINNNELIELISKQSGEARAMPQGGPRLPQNLIDLIVQWKNEGFLKE